MEKYKKASRLALRVQTNKGLLSVEQLWQLKESDLASAIKLVYEEIGETKVEGLDFLSDNYKKVNSEAELKFDILKDIYETKTKERKEAILTQEEQKKKDVIARILEEKKMDDLKSMTIEQLEKLLNE